MSELDEKLNALLSDPGKMAQVMQLAQQLSGSMGNAAPPPPTQQPAPPMGLGGLDIASMARFLPLLQELNSSNSQVTQLLYALRPYLKNERQEKIERALQLARLFHIGKKFLSGWEG